MKRTKFKTLKQLEQEIMKAMNDDYTFAGRTFNPVKNGWRFKFDKAILRLGYCSYMNKTISLSQLMCEKNLDNWKDVRDILLHEISHAFSYKLHGRNHDTHGPKFKAIAKTLGCVPDASVKKDTSGLNLEYHRYVYECPVCKKKYPKHRKYRVSRSCGKCDSNFNPKYILQLTTHES